MGCDWWDVECKAREAVSAVSNTVNRELSNAGNSINSALDASGVSSGDPIKDLTNLASGGIWQIDQNGQVSMGTATRWVSEAVGELTGANQARRANNIFDQLELAQRYYWLYGLD